MPETPRTWTLYEHKAFHGTEARGPDLASSIEDDPPAPIEVVEKAPVDAERERLRRRTHEIAEAKDAEHAAVKRELGRLKLAVDQARERTKDWKADWAFPRDPNAPFQWWHHTSHNHAMEAVALVAERNEAVAERERLLDLIARVEDWLQVPDYTRYSDLVSARQVEADVKTVLREYGRLGKEES